MTNQDIVALGVAVCKAHSKNVDTFSYSGRSMNVADMDSQLADEFRALAGNFNAYRRNKNDVFEIMQEIVDEVLPQKLLDKYAEWAEIKTVSQGNSVRFSRRTGKRRAKQFITRVGLAGIYEVFKLDKEFFEVEMTAYGGAAQIGFEEFLDGLVDFSELTEILIEGLDEAVYREIAKAMTAIYNQLPAANVHTGNTFIEAEFDRLIATARAYGTPVIYTTLEFAQKLQPRSWMISEVDRAQVKSQGYVSIYKGGVRIVVMPQTFEDNDNSKKVFDPSYCYIIPAGSGNEKPVKIAFEGQTIVDEFKNEGDRSTEIQMYKKMGVGLMVSNDACIYRDTSLTIDNTPITVDTRTVNYVSQV